MKTVSMPMNTTVSKLLWVNHRIHAVHILYRLVEDDTAVLAVTEYGRCALYVDDVDDSGKRNRSVNIYQNWMFLPF